MEELFKDYGKVIIRTPLYSYLSLFDSNKRTKNLEEMVHLRLADPVFLEALYWSSPQLYQAVLKFKEGVMIGVKEKKLLQTLKKYVIRASTRCTPYGIYAGTCITDIGFNQKNQNFTRERKVRIDMGLMQSLKAAIESDPVIYPHLFYSVNNSLYSIPDQYRFMETIIENGPCHHQLISLQHSDFLEELIILSKNRMVSIEDIYALAENDTPKEEFNDFVKDLIESRFLISELQLELTGGDDLQRYLNVLKRLTVEGVEEAKRYIGIFSIIQNILLQFEKSAIGELPLEKIKDLKVLLNECGIAEADHLFHADLKQPVTEAFLFSKEKLKEIKHGIAALGKLGYNPSPLKGELEKFKKLFREKYETREISLSEALDPEFGIGFPTMERIGDAGFNSLIEKIDVTSANIQTPQPENCKILLDDKAEALNHYLLNESIDLNDDDLKDFEDKISSLPSTFSICGSLLPSGKILLESAGGAHANSLLGRFAYLDGEIMDLCKAAASTEREMNKETIFAEIIFIPEERLGNIARRPVLSDYEIPVLARSGLKKEKQILVDDLLVSIQNDEIILRSKKLGNRIIPRLSNAHNYMNSLVPVYQFLCALQQQGKCSFGIGSGNVASKKRFLPRIECKNIILRRACWLLDKSEIAAIIKTDTPLKGLRDFFARWNVPPMVSFIEGDRELFIDTGNESYLQLLLEEMKAHNTVKLVEWIYDSVFDNFKTDHPLIQQFILPLFRKNIADIPPLRKPKTAKYLKRTFEPGSEWVYFKIYCGSTVSDKILLNVVKPSVDSLLETKVINSAFFIRYTDPHYHIRFRLHLVNSANKEHLATVMKCTYDLLHPFCENGSVWKVQLDTYEREIERYGEDFILATEIVFFHDSILYLNCLQYQEFLENEQTRLFAALGNLDRWLTLFKMGIEEKAAYCKYMCNCFSNEYKPEIKVQMEIKYRELKNLLPLFFNADKFDDAFRERDKNLENILSIKENMQSFIHMSLNRWFVNQQSLMEYMCYLFCSKYYHQLLNYSQLQQTVYNE